MKKAISILALTFGFALCSLAQGITFSHSQERMEMVRYVGSADAMPCETYFSTVHPTYKKASHAWGLLPNQTGTVAIDLQAPSLADSLQSSMSSRAEVEAMNMADKKVDMTQATAQGKVQAALAKMQAALNSALSSAFTYDMRQYWQKRMEMHAAAFNETRSAYQPNSYRIEGMLGIANDIMNDVRDIYGMARFVASGQAAKERSMAVFRPARNASDIVGDAVKAGYASWRTTMTLAAYNNYKGQASNKNINLK